MDTRPKRIRNCRKVGRKVALALLASLSLACSKTESSGTPSASPTTSAAPAASTSPVSKTATPSASATVAASAVPVTPKIDAPDCVAKTKGKQSSVGAVGGRVLGMAAAGGAVYVLRHEEASARASVMKLPRQGGKPAKLGQHVDAGTPNSFIVTADAAFFTMRGNIIKISLKEERVEKIASDFPKAITSYAGHVYGVRCSKKKTYELVRVPEAGGDVAVVASWDRGAVGKCKISSLAVNEQNAIVADWPGRRLFQISLASGKATEVGNGYPFPDSVILHGDSFVFQSSKGVSRIPQTGGDAKLVTSIGTSPFHVITSDGVNLYIINEDAYGASGSIERVPLTGGTPEKLTAWQVRDDAMGGGIGTLAVDDQCFYFGKFQTNFTGISAKQK